MATLTLRSVKGSPLTNSEVDGNFTALNTELATKLTATDYNAADVLTKLKTVITTVQSIARNKKLRSDKCFVIFT